MQCTFVPRWSRRRWHRVTTDSVLLSTGCDEWPCAAPCCHTALKHHHHNIVRHRRHTYCSAAVLYAFRRINVSVYSLRRRRLFWRVLSQNLCIIKRISHNIKSRLVCFKNITFVITKNDNQDKNIDLSLGLQPRSPNVLFTYLLIYFNSATSIQTRQTRKTIDTQRKRFADL